MSGHQIAASTHQVVGEMDEATAQGFRVAWRRKHLTRRSPVEKHAASKNQRERREIAKPGGPPLHHVRRERREQTRETHQAENPMVKRRIAAEEQPGRIGDDGRHIEEPHAVLERTQGHDKGVHEEPAENDADDRKLARCIERRPPAPHPPQQRLT